MKAINSVCIPPPPITIVTQCLTMRCLNYRTDKTLIELCLKTRNAYRHYIPAGFKRNPNSGSQDLISFEQEDEVEQLKKELAAKDQIIEAFETREKDLSQELVAKGQEIDKLNATVHSLQEREATFEQSLADSLEQADYRLKNMEECLEEKEDQVKRMQEELNQLQEKRDDLGGLLENLNREHLQSGKLFWDTLRNRDDEIERQKQLTTLQNDKLRVVEEELAGRERELQEMGNEFGKRLAEKERELEKEQLTIAELRSTIEGHSLDLATQLSECESTHMHKRKELLLSVHKALAKKSLTPALIGLKDEEWATLTQDNNANLQRSWSWRYN